MKPLFIANQSNAIAWQVERIKNMLDQLGDNDVKLLTDIERMLKSKVLSESVIKQPGERMGGIGGINDIGGDKVKVSEDLKKEISGGKDGLPEIDPNDPWG